MAQLLSQHFGHQIFSFPSYSISLLTRIPCEAYRETNYEVGGVEVYQQRGDTESGNSSPPTVKKWKRIPGLQFLKLGCCMDFLVTDKIYMWPESSQAQTLFSFRMLTNGGLHGTDERP